MADMIQGLSIGLNLDTSGIEQSLKGLKGQLKAVDSEMRVNMSAFSRSEKSVGKYETQIGGLNKKLDAQKAAVNAARREHEQMVAQHGEGSRQAQVSGAAYNNLSADFNNLQRHIGDLTDEFQQFQREQEIAESRFGKLSSSLEDVGGKLSAVGDKVSTAGKGLTIGLTAPIVGFGAAGVAAFNEVDEAIDTVITKTGATGEAAEVLTENFRTVAKRVPDDLQAVGDAIGEVNTQFGFMGKELEDNSQLMLEFANINGTDVTSSSIASKQAIEAYGLANSDLGNVLDAVTQTAQDTGQSVDDLFDKATKGAPQIKALGLNFAEGTALIGGFEKAGVDSGAALSSLSKAQVIFAKDGKTLEEGLNGTVKSILNAKTETEALTIASEVFGTKGGPRMVDAIQRGTFNLEDFTGAGEKAAGAVKETFNETVDPIDQAAIAMNNAKLAMSEVGEVLQVAALPFMQKATEIMGNLADKFRAMSPEAKQTSLVIAGIAAAIGPVLVAVGSMISMFGGAMTALAPLALKIAQAGGMLKYLRGAMLAFTGPVGIAVAVIAGLTIGFIALYKNSETFRDMISTLITKVKELASQALAALKPAIATVVGFFKDQLKVIQDFWSQNSATILSALENIGGFVSKVFNGIMAVIQFVMPAVLALINAVWGNIKGVITGALDVIMGAVKVFSGLFSGDFSKMWEGVKQMFTGAITFLWNFISLTFFGKLLGGAKLFVGAFKGVFTSLWAGLKTLFTGSLNALKSSVSTSFSAISSTTSRIFNGIWNFLKSIFNSIRTSIDNAVLTIYTKVVTSWTNIFNKTSSIFNSIFNAIRNIFNSIKNAISTAVGNVLTKVTNTWNSLKTTTSNVFGSIFTAVKGKFDDIVNAAKALPQRIGDGIGSMASKVKSGVTRVINNLASTLGKGVNGVIGGINWVLGKIGADKDIPKWTVPQYAQGTKGHVGGLAVVGDGKGSNAGSELIRTPDGEMQLSPSKDTLVNLPKGTQVFSAKQTREYMESIPHYKNGVGGKLSDLWEGTKNLAGKAWEGTKKVGNKVKDVAVNAFDYIKSPGKFLDLALKTLGIEKPKGGSFVGNMAVGGWNKVKEAALSYVKNKMSDFGSSQSGISLTGGNGGGFGSPFRFTSGPGPRNTGIPGASRMHKGWDWAAPIGTKIPSVTDGIGYRTGFHRLSGNFVEVKSGNKIHRYQHNSRNIMKVGQKVKKGQTLGLVGDTGVGSGAHLHYEVRGLETGGIVKKEQMVRVGEKNREEVVIPMHPSRRTDAMKLLALAGRKISGGSDKGIIRPNQIPNVGSGSNNDSVLKSLLAATIKQNEILMQLLNKNTDVYMNTGELVGAIGDPIDSRLGNSSRNNMYMNGVR
ncbi:phage tail tape measure protein [Planococcus sp. SE5232]|uniref:phage tail tape measure protein n=1 Tax=unclassified Planococcus (in: firmicutes) TaxID=2662419 RepID=UPI003D6A25AB